MSEEGIKEYKERVVQLEEETL